MNYLKQRSQSGFTLIELLVVVAIISILTGLVGSNYLTSRARARDAERKNSIQQVQSALEMYMNDNGQYPATMATTGNGRIRPFRWGLEAFTNSENGHPETVYMSILPGDPTGGAYQFHYEVNDVLTKYRVCGILENDQDADIQTEYTDKVCSESNNTTYCNYCVSSSNTTLTEAW
jgi:type II secretion system protein G